MKKRRVLSLVLAFVMLMSCCFTGTTGHVHAVGTEPTIVVSEVKAEAGKTAAVSIALENNPGIVSVRLYVTYDTEKLTLVEAVDADILGEDVFQDVFKSPYTLTWANDTAKENLTVTGTIVTLFFEVADSATEGDVATVEVSYGKNDIVDKDMQEVPFEIDNGSVTVGQPDANPISDFTYELSGSEMTITGYTGGARDVIIGSKYTVGGTEYTVTAIADEAFIENTDITSVVIPETVKYIGEAAFYDCTSLTEVTVLSEDAEIGEVALGYYYISRKEDGVVEGFTIKGYPNSTAQTYAETDDGITFVALEKACEHTGGEATCKDKAVCTKCGQPYGELNSSNHKNTETRDATTPSCDEPGYTGDTWCKDCETKTATGTSIPATEDHEDADGDWEVNQTHHFHTCNCGTEFDRDSHTGGAATCKEKAVCSVCGTPYGDLNSSNHTGGTYLVGQKEATCYEEGYTGDTYCSGCDVKIATGTAIEKDSHNPASVWSTDETHHWKECTVVACGNIIDRAEHTGGEATCSAKAVCSVCGVAYGSLNANNHKNTEIRDAATPSCNAPGYTGDTWCKDCETKIETGDPIPATGNHIDADNKWESNENQHFHTCSCGTEFDKADHTGGEATCKTKAVCSVCGASYGELNANNHKDTEVRDAAEASCTTPGYTGDTWCKDCETKIATGTPIPAAHKTVKVPAVEATHEKDGNIEYFTCSGCDKLFSNEAATTVITLADTVIAKGEHSYGETYEKDAENHWKLCSCGHIADKAAHTFGDWAETKAPTDKTPGEKRRECSVCKHYETAEIPVVSYEITHGADSEWTVGTNGELVFRANGEFAKFVGVEIDGQTVDPKNYTAVAGSTVITLKADYLDTLSVGEHTIKVVYQDGSASTNFEIQSKAASSDTPQTGDNSNLLLWIALMFVSGSALILTFGFSKKRMKHSR